VTIQRGGEEDVLFLLYESVTLGEFPTNGVCMDIDGETYLLESVQPESGLLMEEVQFFMVADLLMLPLFFDDAREVQSEIIINDQSIDLRVPRRMLLRPECVPRD